MENHHIHVVLGTLQIALREMRFSILNDIYANILAVGNVHVSNNFTVVSLAGDFLIDLNSNQDDTSRLKLELANLLRRLPAMRFNVVCKLCFC